MESLIEEVHEDLASATILLCWRNGSKPDADGVLSLGSIKKASDADRAEAAVFNGAYDFVIQLNENAWKGLSDDDKVMAVDQLLCRAAPDMDANGEQKVDTKDCLCWRLRKFQITTFPEIIERYGQKRALRMNDTVIKASEDAKQPLLAGLDVDDSDPKGWRKLDVEVLGVKAFTKKAQAGGVDFGKLHDLMMSKGSWWFKDIEGVGQTTASKVNEAVAQFQVDHPKCEFPSND